MGKTAAQEQLDHLMRLKEERERAPRPVSQARAEERAPAKDATLRLVAVPKGNAPRRSRKTVGLPMHRETWKAFLERQKAHSEFRSKRELADWVAELLMGLPKGLHQAVPEAKRELFARIAEWAKARGWM